MTRLLPVLSFLVACTATDQDGAGTPTDSADPADSGEPALACVAGESFQLAGGEHTLDMDGLQVLSASTNLTVEGFQPLEAATCGWTSGEPLVNIFMTSVNDLASGWDEEHVLSSASRVEADAATPPLDMLSLSLAHVDTLGAWERSQTTLFNSDDDGGLTYALRVYDADGSLADCVAWGHDVEALFAGEVPANNPAGHTDMDQLSAERCRVLDG